MKTNPTSHKLSFINYFLLYSKSFIGVLILPYLSRYQIRKTQKNIIKIYLNEKKIREMCFLVTEKNS